MIDDFDIKIDETKKHKTIVYRATLIYKGDNTEFIDYIEKLNTSGKLTGSQINIQELSSVTITFYYKTNFEHYQYNYDYDDNPKLAVYYKDGYDGFLSEFYNKLTEYKLDTKRFLFLKKLKGISYGMLLCCICKAIKSGLIKNSSTIILEASGNIIDMDSRQSIGNLVKYYERIGFKKMFPDYYDIAINSESGYIPMIAQVKDIISLCNFKNVSKELLTILPTDLCRDICTQKEDNVSYICDKLTTTYNTNILDSASDIIKEKFLLTSLTHRNGNEGKKALMNLICNHFEKDRPKPRFIGGPKNLTVHHSKEHNKMIYIFGEYHSDIVDCDIRFGDESTKETWDKPNSKKMRVEYFLSEFIRTTDVFLDIFVEFPIVPKNTGKYHDKYQSFPDGHLKKLLDNFKQCLQPDTRTEVCSLARIHYFDTRLEDYEGIVKASNRITNFVLNVNYIFENFFEDERIKQLKICIQEPEIKGLLDELTERDEKKFKRIWVNYLTDISHNAKELDRLEKDPVMQHNILDFIQKEITKKAMKWKTFFNDNVNIIFNNDKHTVLEFVNAFELVKNGLNRIGSRYADLYTLLRVFKTFNMSEMKQKAYKEATDQPDKAHNIIIYAGDSHSQLYRKFLKEVLDFDKIEVAGKEEPYGRAGELMYCIDMEPITQPLFSKYHQINKQKDTATDEIKPLVAKQQDKSSVPMTFSPFEPDDIILSDRIFGGASHEPVWNGSLRGNPVIYKLMNKHEYNILMKVQGIGVVRVLYKTENYKLPDEIDEIDRVGILVAMEKLDTIKLHPDYNTGAALDTKYSLMIRVEKGVLLNMHSFDFNNLRTLLNTIVEINNMGILWGDLKQENIGVDKDGNLRIFDFSESRTISSDLKNKHFDILAYGKLLYNIITQNFAFNPGRHYRGRDLTSDEFLQVIDMIQDIDSISKNALQKCFLLNNESTDNDISESIKELYRMLDFNQNKSN
jgi:hypothetical protein